MRRCGGRPKQPLGGARAARPEACGCETMREIRAPRRRIHRPSRETSSLFSDCSFCRDFIEPLSVGCQTREECFIGRADFCAAAGWNYNRPMDSGRLGRVLGIGTRLAARTLVQAVDAATAPNPSAQPKQGKAENAGRAAAARVTGTANRVRVTGTGLKEGGKRFGEAVWGPLARASGALWLELTGVFFGIFAVFAGGNAWKMRWALHETTANHDAHSRLLISVGMMVVFGYFCASSFVKASRRSRG